MFQLTIQEFDFMKKIILLKHDSLNHDSKILGLFYADDIVNIIKYYSHLPGFSSNTSGFDISKSIRSIIILHFYCKFGIKTMKKLY